MKYVLRWWYTDSSSSGVLPRVYTEEQRDLLRDLLTMDEFSPMCRWEFVEVSV